MTQRRFSERSKRRLRWALPVGLALALAGVAWRLVPEWTLARLVLEAERRGVRLSGCELELRWALARLSGCGFTLLPEATRQLPLAAASASGQIAELELAFSGLRPERLRVRRAQVEVRGQPVLAALAPAPPPAAPPPAAPPPALHVEQTSVSWRLEPSSAPEVTLSELSYVSATGQLHAAFAWRERLRGELSVADRTLNVVVGETARPLAVAELRVVPQAQRLEARLELRRFPLSLLEGPELALTPALRSIELDGRAMARIPLGLSSESPGGDFRFTLHHLQFPIPRELEGLVYQSAPTVSGHFELSRSFDRVETRDLAFTAGQLSMTGRARATSRVPGKGMDFEVHSSGPLSCRAVAQAAVRARADSRLARMAAMFATRALAGDVRIVADLSGNTRELARAAVVTTIGVGCGLSPLPVDSAAALDLLRRLPDELERRWPRSNR